MMVGDYRTPPPGTMVASHYTRPTMGNEPGKDLSPSTVARILSALIITPESDIAVFRRRALGRKSEVPIERLATMRRALLALGDIALGGDDAAWDRAEAAHCALEVDSGETVAEVGSGDATAKPMVPPPAHVHARASEPQPTAFAAASAPRSVTRSSPWVGRVNQPVAPPPSKSLLEVAVQTAEVGSVSPLAGTELPFSGDGPPPPIVGDQVAREVNAGETISVRYMSPLAMAAQLMAKAAPEGETSGGDGGSQTPEAPPNEPEAPPQGAESASSETAMVGAVSPLAGMLPFANAKAANPLPSVSDEVADEADAGATAAAGQLSPLALSALAPSKPPSPPVELTLEQYANLCASLDVYPERRAPTLHAYQLADERALQSLNAHWKTKLSSDADAQAQCNVLIARYVEWLKSQG